MTGWFETGCPLKAFQNTRVVASSQCCILTEFIYLRPCGYKRQSFTGLDIVKMHLCAMAIISFEYHRQYRVMKVNNKSAIGAVGELLVSSSTREKCRVKITNLLF